AHHQAQLHRLSTSRQGRAILQILGHPTEHLPPIPPPPPPWDGVPRIEVRPIPRNMDPDRNKTR
ncbi:hypothetical protein IscW_ISCW003199, partial [Ixodes scapularis]